MTLLILVAVATAFLAGLLLLPVTMPQAKRFSAAAALPTPDALMGQGESLSRFEPEA